MMGSRRVGVPLTVSFLLMAAHAGAQTSGGTAALQTAAPETEAAGWSWSAAAYTYLIPDDDDYVQPTVKVDHDWLHLEGRFNYEDRDTASAWVGYNFSVGDTVTFEITPMVGAVFGNTAGVGLSYEGALTWRRLDLSSETEFVFDSRGLDDSFLYTWSELGWSPADWFRAGLVVQRTKAYQTAFDIQRGLFAGVSLQHLDVAAYVFYPDESRPAVVIGVTLHN